MLLKMLMCPCYAEKFHEEKNDYKKNFNISSANMKQGISFLFFPAKKYLYVADKTPIWSLNVHVQSLDHMKSAIFANK